MLCFQPIRIKVKTNSELPMTSYFVDRDEFIEKFLPERKVYSE